MNKAQKYLLDKKLSDVVLNKKEYAENTPENAKKWIYLSDLLEEYSAHENMVTDGDNLDELDATDGSLGGIIIPDLRTDKNIILSRAMTYLSEDAEECGMAKQVFDELASLMDSDETTEI